MKKLFLLVALFLFLTHGLLFAKGQGRVDNAVVKGYRMPEICTKTNIRCIYKQYGKSKYWCMKTSHQRTMDSSRNTEPIRKTRRQRMGNCHRIIPIIE